MHPTPAHTEQSSDAIAKIEYPPAVAPGILADACVASGGTQGNGRGAGRAGPAAGGRGVGWAAAARRFGFAPPGAPGPPG